MDYISRSSGVCTQSMPLNNLVSDSSIFRSTRNLDDEVENLKNIYETELEKLRKDVETSAHERNILQAQCNNQQTYVLELHSKLSIETDKNSRLLGEISTLQRKIGDLDSELQGRHITMQDPQERLDQLRTFVGNLSREVDQWKYKYEHEQQTSSEKDKRLQQLIKQAEFTDQVHDQEIKYYQARLDVASATILNFEARIQELNTTCAPVNELPKQASTVKAGTEINCQTESLNKHTRTGKDLPQQNKILEGAAIAENGQTAASKIQDIMTKIREVYNMLTVKMSSVADNNESNINLKSEIEVLKVLLDKEERRLDVPSDPDTTQVLQVKTSKRADADQALILGISEAHQEKNHQPGISFSCNNNEAMVDQHKGGATSQAYNTSQLLTSVSTSNVVTSVPMASLVTTGYDYSSNYLNKSDVASSVYPYENSPPINTFYIPKELRTSEKCILANSVDFNERHTTDGLHMAGSLLPTGSQYGYKTLYDQKESHTNTSLPLTSHVLGPIHAIPMSTSGAPAQIHFAETEDNKDEEAKASETEKNFDSIPEYNVQQERSKSSQLERMISPNSTDTTSSALGDLKILEVSDDGKYVRILNDGPTEFDFGGYMVQQIISDHPVAVFRFPQHTKFPPNSTVTVWSALSDPSVHNPPTDFFWKQQKKWETGSNCTTALCRANGQMVAWTRAGHRFTKDAFNETSTSKQDIADYDVNNSQNFEDDVNDHENLTELQVDLKGQKSEPVYLRRAKKQPPTLVAAKHPYGFNPASYIHPLTGQPRPLHFGNDNSTYSRQSRTQTIRPDPICRQSCSSAPNGRIGNKTSTRKNQRVHSAAVKENDTLALSIGEICEGPSPFMRPHNRFGRGLDQVCSQHHSDFLPPMPKTFL